MQCFDHKKVDFFPTRKALDEPWEVVICRVFLVFWRENTTDLGFSENTCLYFLCPRWYYIKSVCSSVVFFSSVLEGIKELTWESFVDFFYLAGKHDRFENVDMLTFQQI